MPANPLDSQRAAVEKPVTPARVRALRLALKEQGLGVRKVAARMGYSHTYLLLVERGQRRITETFRIAFRHLEADYFYILQEADAPETDAFITVVSEHPLPKRLHILRKPIRCKCGIWFEPVNSRQRRCSPDCKAALVTKKKKGDGA